MRHKTRIDVEDVFLQTDNLRVAFYGNIVYDTSPVSVFHVYSIAVR